MNNCPKCGNPLQAGVNSCPICGTNISVASGNQTAQSQPTNIQVASVSTPVSAKPEQNTSTRVAEPSQPSQVESTITNEQVVSAQAEQQPEVKVTPVEETSAPVNQETQVPQVAQAPVETVVQTVQNTPTIVPTPVQETTPQPAPQAPVNVAQIAPTIETPVPSSPIPSIPSSLSNPTNISVQSPVMTPEVKPAPKKKSNKSVILVGVVLLLVIVASGVYFTLNNGKKLQNPNNQNPNQDSDLAAITSVSSNGYKFNLQEEWMLTEDGSNVILTNTDNTVVIKLDHTSSNISNINEEMIKNFVNGSSLYESPEVSSLQISAKDAYLVSARVNDLPVQIYFIGGGSNLILGATIIYQSDDTKTKYEANVTEMIGTISYADESIKAISTMDKYSDIFNIYKGIINSPNKEQDLPQVDYDNNENNNNNEITDNTPSELPIN